MDPDKSETFMVKSINDLLTYFLNFLTNFSEKGSFSSINIHFDFDLTLTVKHFYECVWNNFILRGNSIRKDFKNIKSMLSFYEESLTIRKKKEIILEDFKDFKTAVKEKITGAMLNYIFGSDARKENIKIMIDFLRKNGIKCYINTRNHPELVAATMELLDIKVDGIFGCRHKYHLLGDEVIKHSFFSKNEIVNFLNPGSDGLKILKLLIDDSLEEKSSFLDDKIPLIEKIFVNVCEGSSTFEIIHSILIELGHDGSISEEITIS